MNNGKLMTIDGGTFTICNLTRSVVPVVSVVKLPVGGSVCHVRREVHSTRVNLKKFNIICNNTSNNRSYCTFDQ
jgi:hypothetical protein